MDRSHAQEIIESHLGLDDSEIALAMEALGFQALSTEALDLIARSQVSRAEAIRHSQSRLFGQADLLGWTLTRHGNQEGR